MPQDILLRIMNDEKLEPRQYHELKSFFRDSWAQVPDRTSSSRSMRPRNVVRRQKNGALGKHDSIKKEEEEKSKKGKKGKKGKKKKDKKQKSGKAKNETKSEESQQKKCQPDFGVASATYVSPEKTIFFYPF